MTEVPPCYTAYLIEAKFFKLHRKEGTTLLCCQGKVETYGDVKGINHIIQAWYTTYMYRFIETGSNVAVECEQTKFRVQHAFPVIYRALMNGRMAFAKLAISNVEKDIDFYRQQVSHLLVAFEENPNLANLRLTCFEVRDIPEDADVTEYEVSDVPNNKNGIRCSVKLRNNDETPIDAGQNS